MRGASGRRHTCGSRAGFDESQIDGMPDKAGGIVDIQFLHQVCAVRVDRPEAEEQCFCDLPVGISLCDVLQDLKLPLRQLLAGCRIRFSSTWPCVLTSFALFIKPSTMSFEIPGLKNRSPAIADRTASKISFLLAFFSR